MQKNAVTLVTAYVFFFIDILEDRRLQFTAKDVDGENAKGDVDYKAQNASIADGLHRISLRFALAK